VKKLIALVAVICIAVMGVPVFAADTTAQQDQVKNIGVGTRNAATGWVEVLDNTHAEAAKGKDMGGPLTGVGAGGAIGVRKGIHRVGAGLIDLLTFWIPKKQPLINPEKARLE
jgi:putative exosortase-associated protein (TIGR04073 family)